jgi:hypothetical protein
MLLSTHSLRPLAVAGLICLTFLCLHGGNLQIYSSPALSQRHGGVGTWESEQGPFSAGAPEEGMADDEVVAEAETLTNHGAERLGIPGLGKPLPPAPHLFCVLALWNC